MSFKVKILPTFEKELKRLAKKYPSLKQEYISLVVELREKPDMGVALGNHCYKIRLSIASKGKGKSGGARVITYIQIKGSTVYLLSIFDKSEKENISDKEIQFLISQIPN